jgi:prophage antirepressor-like protein
MNEIKVINKSMLLGKEIDVYGSVDEPLFLAKDVAEWIEHTQPSKMVETVDEDEKLMGTIFLSGQNREVWMLTEDGLYEVLMQSRKPIAKQFKKGIKEILKTIRKTGSYSVSKPLSQLEVLQVAVNQMVEQEKRLSGVERLALEQKERLDKMELEQADNAKALLEVELSDNKVPEVTMRNKIRKLVNQYSRATNTKQQDVWHSIYDTLYYAHNISINSYKRKKRQSNLDIAEKHGFLGKMFDVISNMAKAANLNIA